MKVGYIYKLCIKDGSLDECYIGSTSCIRKRKYEHKSLCKNSEREQLVHRFINENGGFVNWTMVELDKIEYNEKAELHRLEREWIERLKPKLNKTVPTRTYNEWYEENRDKKQVYKKQYYKDNQNKKIEYQKQYYNENKDKISQYEKTRVKCNVCNKELCRGSLSKHIKSQHSNIDKQTTCQPNINDEQSHVPIVISDI